MTPQETIARTREILTEFIKQSTLEVRFMCPTPVWDNTGAIYGVLLESDVMMGEQECTSQVSFVLAYDMDEEDVQERVATALDLIFYRMTAKIAPKKKAAA